jgi:phosphoribosylanthranilate isomerase
VTTVILPRRGRPFCGLVQAAGVHDAREALVIAQSGIRCIGLPLRLPVHTEDITEHDAAALCRMLQTLPPSAAGPVCPVCITYLDTAQDIRELCRMLGTAHVQLHGGIPVHQLAALRAMMPGLYIIKSLVVRQTETGKDNLEELTGIIDATAQLVDAYITDTHDPASGADGATGKTHDWRTSRALVRRSPLPVILAGGLTPQNVRQAVLTVRPAGVDAHTGLENPAGRKDPALCHEFARQAAAAFRQICNGDTAGSGRSRLENPSAFR